MQIRCIYKSAGKCSLAALILLSSLSPAGAEVGGVRRDKKAAVRKEKVKNPELKLSRPRKGPSVQELPPPMPPAKVTLPPTEANPFSNPAFNNEWTEFERTMREKIGKDRTDGLSYVISGSLALVGGLIGQGTTKDPLEKGVYTLFQSIGVASIGYGFYTWKLGDEDRWIYDIIERAPSLSSQDKATIIQSYKVTKVARAREQRFVRALTHGLIAALNIYGATQQSNDTLRSTLYFLGGVNTLAAISLSF